MHKTTTKPTRLATIAPKLSVGLQGSYIFTPDPDLLANRRPSRLFSYSAISATSASLGSLSAVNYRAELCMLLYNHGNTLIYLYLYLDLQSEYYQLSLHFFFDPCLATDNIRQATCPTGWNFMAQIKMARLVLVRQWPNCSGCCSPLVAA